MGRTNLHKRNRELRQIRMRKRERQIQEREQERKEKKKSNRRLRIAAIIFFTASICYAICQTLAYDVILPKYGKETEAVLAGKENDGRVHRFYYVFYKDGKSYKCWAKDWKRGTPIRLEKKVRVLYLEMFPSINTQIE